MNWTATANSTPPSAGLYLVRLANPRGKVEYLVGWWDSLEEGEVKPHWVFEDLKRKEVPIGTWEPTHWCRIKPPREGV